MPKKSFYTISNIDMSKVYREVLLKTADEELPEILIFDNQPSDIVRYEMPNGKSILGFKNCDEICEKIVSELKTPKAEKADAPDFMVHSLDNEKVSLLYCVAVLMSEMLEIPCPQIEFRELPEELYGWAESKRNHVVLKTFPSELIYVMIRYMAHEFRHLWQHKYRPEYSESYVRAEDEDSIADYFNCISEIDAEAWACKLALEVLGVDDLKQNKDYVRGNVEVKQKIMKLRDEIELNEEYVYRLRGYLGMGI